VVAGVGVVGVAVVFSSADAEVEVAVTPSQKRVSQANRHRRPWNYSISNLSTIVGAHTEKSCEKEMESRNATASEVDVDVDVEEHLDKEEAWG